MNIFRKILGIITGHKPKSYSLTDLNLNGNHLGWDSWDEKTLVGNKNKLRSGDLLKIKTKSNSYTFKIGKVKAIGNNKSKIYLKAE